MTNNPSTPATDEGLHRNSDMPLDSLETTGSSVPDLRSAAVLIPLVVENNEWHILFIRRAHNKQDRHSGQVAFPGGAADDADNASATNTALRETHEEIGISQEFVQPLLEMQPYITVSNYSVTPVVGIVEWPAKLALQSDEVSRAFTIPMNWLRQRNNFELRPRSDVDKAASPRQADRAHPIVIYREYDGEVLWGATARMTLNFIQALDLGRIDLPAA